jgi:hypothetical protein
MALLSRSPVSGAPATGPRPNLMLHWLHFAQAASRKLWFPEAVAPAYLDGKVSGWVGPNPPVPDLEIAPHSHLYRPIFCIFAPHVSVSVSPICPAPLQMAGDYGWDPLALG